MGEESLESMAVIDKKWLTGLPSRLFPKIKSSSLWVLSFITNPHDQDRPKPESPPPPTPPFDDSFDLEALTHHSTNSLPSSPNSQTQSAPLPIAYHYRSSPTNRSLTSSRTEELPLYHVRSTNTQQTSPESRPQILNPIVQLLRDQDLGKTVLGFVMPMTTGLLSVYAEHSSPLLMQLTLLSLCIGLAALWNGILLREAFPRAANAVEQLGAASILLTFYGVIGSFLPPSLVWGCWVCFGLSVLPFFMSYLPIRERALVN